MKGFTRRNSRNNTQRTRRKHAIVETYDGKGWVNVGTVLWTGKQSWRAQLVVPSVVNLGPFRSKRHALASAWRTYYAQRTR